MNRAKPRSLADVINQGRLGEIAAKARSRQTTSAQIRSILPAEEAKSVVDAHWEDDQTLVLIVSSPAWAARIKTKAPETLGAQRLKVRVVPRPDYSA